MLDPKKTVKKKERAIKQNIVPNAHNQSSIFSPLDATKIGNKCGCARLRQDASLHLHHPKSWNTPKSMPPNETRPSHFTRRLLFLFFLVYKCSIRPPESLTFRVSFSSLFSSSSHTKVIHKSSQLVRDAASSVHIRYLCACRFLECSSSP